MEKSKQLKVIELYDEKLKVERDLIKISKHDIKFGYDVNGFSRFSSVSNSFLAEIKKLTEVHLQQRIEEIDKELNEL